MRQAILNFPQQFKKELKLKAEIKGDFDNVVVSAMGGSAWPAEILFAWLKPKFHWQVNRNYSLPPQTNKKTLCVFISYSGNTEECLSCYDQALKKGYSLAVITSNGQLKSLAEKNNSPCIVVPQGWVQRMATGYIFIALYSILLQTGLVKDKKEEIMKLSDKLNPLSLEEKGKDLAQKLKHKIPLIYAPAELRVLSFSWEIKFNENAKSPAFSDYFPELDHNELEGMTHLTKTLDKNPFYCLILKDPEDEPRLLKRMDLTAKLLKQKDLPIEIIILKGQTLLEKIFSSLILADWTSYYLSQAYGVNPLKTEMIDELKKEMRE